MPKKSLVTDRRGKDSRIFWNLLNFYDGDYRVIPLAYPVSMDANTAPKFWDTVKNLYKQHRRWGYGAENIAYIFFNFIKSFVPVLW